MVPDSRGTLDVAHRPSENARLGYATTVVVFVAAPRALSFATAAATALGVLAVAAAVDAYLTHGLTVDWYQTDEEGERIRLGRTTEHRVVFPNSVRPLSRVVDHWDFHRLGVPARVPELDAEIHALLTVPSGERRTLDVLSPNRTVVLLDGKDATEPIGPGQHELTVRWRGDFDPHASLRLVWRTQDASQPSAIPRQALRPIEPPTPDRTLLWMAAVATAVFLGATVFLTLHTRSHTVFSARSAWLPIALILLLGTILRLFDYSAIPDFRENGDGLFATWNGWQLLTDGTTRGWSLWWEIYGDRVETEELPYFREEPFYVIQPYLEHPPAMHLLAGAAAKLGGATHWSHARFRHTRLVPVLLGVLTLVLVMCLGYEIQRGDKARWAPLIGGLLYAVLPTIVIQSRAVKEEALLTPLALGSMWALARHLRQPARRWLLLASLLAGLCPLAKIPGAVMPLALGTLLWINHRRRDVLIALIASLVAVATLLLYAVWVDWDLFRFATELQVRIRSAHWNLFPRFFVQPMINRNGVGAGWLIFLWFAWIAVAMRRKQPGSEHPGSSLLLVVPTVAYLTGIAVSSGSWTFGWYLWPILPFLCVAAGRYLEEQRHHPDLLGGVAFVMFLVGYTMSFHAGNPLEQIPRALASNPDGDVSRRAAHPVCLYAFIQPLSQSRCVHRSSSRTCRHRRPQHFVRRELRSSGSARVAGHRRSHRPSRLVLPHFDRGQL